MEQRRSILAHLGLGIARFLSYRNSMGQTPTCSMVLCLVKNSAKETIIYLFICLFFIRTGRYVYIYIYICVHIYIYMCVYIYIYMHIYIFALICPNYLIASWGSVNIGRCAQARGSANLAKSGGGWAPQFSEVGQHVMMNHQFDHLFMFMSC